MHIPEYGVLKRRSLSSCRGEIKRGITFPLSWRVNEEDYFPPACGGIKGGVFLSIPDRSEALQIIMG